MQTPPGTKELELMKLDAWIKTGQNHVSSAPRNWIRDVRFRASNVYSGLVGGLQEVCVDTSDRIVITHQQAISAGIRARIMFYASHIVMPVS